MHFWQAYFSLHALLCLNTDDGNLNHLDRVVFAGIPHCEVTLFLFVINNYDEKTTLRLCKYPVSLQTLPANFSSHQWIACSSVTVVF